MQFQAKPHIKLRGGQPIIEYRVPSIKAAQQFYPAQSYASFLSCVREPYAGAWQKNDELQPRTLLTSAAIYRCISLISGDVSKLRLMITEQQDDGTWLEINSTPWPVLRKPNHYQTRAQFFRDWITSKLVHGNTYVLKERDERGLTTTQGGVRALYILNPTAVTTLVADNGEVFYRLGRDNLARIDENDGITVPASEIIHDRTNCFWHPLIGVPPLYAAALSATHGLTMQQNQSKFFENMSRPSGLLTSPGRITEATAARLQTLWQENFSGSNLGRIAVMGDGLKYEAMTIPPQQAQLAEQLGWTERNIGMAFGVPPYKLGLSSPVAFGTAAQMNQDYYDQCLNSPLEELEQCMDEGLGLPADRRTEFDTDGLLRMDPLAQADTNQKRIGSGELAPNEARRKSNLPPVAGGDSPFLQQQNYSLAALAKRDARDDPFAATPPNSTPAKELMDEFYEQVQVALAVNGAAITNAMPDLIERGHSAIRTRIDDLESSVRVVLENARSARAATDEAARDDESDEAAAIAFCKSLADMEFS